MATDLPCVSMMLITGVMVMMVMHPSVMVVECARHPIMGGGDRGMDISLANPEYEMMGNPEVCQVEVDDSSDIPLPTDARDENGCPAGLPYTTATATRGQYCYQFVNNEVYWTHARNYCWQYGGWLVTIDDAATNSFIVRTLNSLSWTNNGVWIGLHDRTQELSWSWVTRHPYEDMDMSWSNWASGHPRGFWHSMRDCIRMKRGRHDDWKWHETMCAVLKWNYNFICQYELPPTTAAPTTAPLPNRADMLHGSQRRTTQTTRPTTMPTTTTKATTTTDQPSSDVYDYGWSEGNYEDIDAYDHKDYYDYEYDEVTDSPNRGDIQHSRQVQEETSTEVKSKQNGIIVLCAVLTILSVSLLIFIIIFMRRRREQEKQEAVAVQNPTYGGKDGKEPAVETKKRAENEYVVNVYSNPLPATEKLLGIPPPKDDVDTTSAPGGHIDYEDAEDFADASMKDRALPATPNYLPMDGSQKMMTSMSGYETPLDAHTYAEIPCGEEQIYESLEDLRMKQTDY